MLLLIALITLLKLTGTPWLSVGHPIHQQKFGLQYSQMESVVYQVLDLPKFKVITIRPFTAIYSPGNLLSDTSALATLWISGSCSALMKRISVGLGLLRISSLERFRTVDWHVPISATPTARAWGYGYHIPKIAIP
jgi:hypothetical protein